MIFGVFFFQSAFICFFSKCVDLVPKFSTLKIFFKVRNFSKCVVTNRTRINSAQSIFFLDYTRRQATSPVAKFCHVLGRAFMIQRVILYKYWLHERVTWEIVTPRKPGNRGEVKYRTSNALWEMWYKDLIFKVISFGIEVNLGDQVQMFKE